MRPENDKPAATGTGSGEALLADQRCCGCGKRYQEHAGRDNLCYTDGRTLTFVPTPPASPTVTLDRETYEKVCTELTRLAQAVCGNDKLRGAEEFYRGYNVVTQRTSAVAANALALLRAAERQT